MALGGGNGAFDVPPVGSRHDPDALANVGRAGVVRAEHSPARIEPQRGQISEHDVEPATGEKGGVLHEDVPGSNLANDSGHLHPEPAALSGDASSAPGCANVLAGEAPADEVDVPAPRSPVEGADVVPDGEAGEHAVSLAGE